MLCEKVELLSDLVSNCNTRHHKVFPAAGQMPGTSPLGVVFKIELEEHQADA